MIAVLCAAIALPGIAHAGCNEVLAALGDTVVDVTCFKSTDLTTNNPATTPADNSIPGLPPGAFTPTTDRTVISPDPPNRTPITKAVPGYQLNGRFADDPANEARFLLRLPDDWNGSLVVAGASGTRSEFNGDFAWSDYVVQKGYAYASQNKGVLNLKITSLNSGTPPTPLSCRLNPASTVWVEFFDNDAVLQPGVVPSKPFTQWTQYFIEGTGLAKRAVKAQYNHHPRRTYAVGTSNGGYQVRRALEVAPALFDGGVDWEGTFVDALGPNILIDLPPAIRNWPDYVASGFNPNSTAAKNIEAAGYPPDIPGAPFTFWGRYWNQFWEVTQCQWQKRFDPAWITYNDGPNDVTGTGGYNYYARIAADPSIAARVAAIATTGNIKRPLITVAGTMDALLPIKRGARAYEELVRAQGRDRDSGGGKSPQYRLYEVQNGNHIETYKNFFPQLEFIQPLAQDAFDRLVDHIENGALLPASQCIPRGKTTLPDQPSQPGHCATLFVP
jgi:3HB-oligomer hydrolase 3HBOH